MTKPQYTVKVDAALDLIQVLDMTRQDFAELALACLDQVGVGAEGVARVRRALEQGGHMTDASGFTMPRVRFAGEQRARACRWGVCSGVVLPGHTRCPRCGSGQ